MADTINFDGMLAAFHDQQDEYVAAVAAEKFLASLDAEGNAALTTWLVEQAPSLIADRFARMDSRRRSTARARQSARAFADGADAAGDDPEALSAFAAFYVVNEDNLRRRVAEMTGADHAFVADAYVAAGNRALMLAAFHRAVAKKVGRRKTGDVLDESTYLSMLGSIAARSTEGSRAQAA